MDRVEIIALLGALAWLALVVEMVRRRRFSEGYSLLWLLSGVAILGLALWRDLLDALAHVLGIYYAPTALFVVAFGLILLLNVQQSALLCEMERRNADLAQRLAILSHQVERLQQRKDESRQMPDGAGQALHAEGGADEH
jgi:hypothetical protein